MKTLSLHEIVVSLPDLILSIFVKRRLAAQISQITADFPNSANEPST